MFGIFLTLFLTPMITAADTHACPSHEEVMASFQLADERLIIEPVAVEPAIADPVAMTFDAGGRLYVVEMADFQIGPDGEDGERLGRVRQLRDEDGDGFYETAYLYADGLALPTAIAPAYGGILVGAAPEIIFLKDTDDDGRADLRKPLFTGFGKKHGETLLNSLFWGIDNWLYGCGNQSQGRIYGVDAPDAPRVSIQDFRLRFRLPADLQTIDDLVASDVHVESATGGGQFGMAPDNLGRRFSCYNNRHVMHMVLPDRYLRRNPWFAPARTWHSCPDHRASCQVYRISPPEPWREIRLKQRLAAGTGDRTPTGYLTAGSGTLIYRGNVLPREYHGNAFTGAAANNLVHRDVLTPDGPTFIASRAPTEQDRDFLASPHLCFRPVAFGEGPDGAIYVVDMCREIIETPLSVPPDIRKIMNFAAGNDQGRIWRIRSRNAPRPQIEKLHAAPSRQLVQHLAHPNAWQRSTAQRLLVERREAGIGEALRDMALHHERPLARLHALRTLEGLNNLDAKTIIAALNDPDAGLREHALQLAGKHIQNDSTAELCIDAILARLDDDSPRVQFQLALTLGELSPTPEVLQAMATLAEQHADNEWMRAAVLSSTHRCAPQLWQKLLYDQNPLLTRDTKGAQVFVRDLIAVAVAQDAPKMLTPLLQSIVDHRKGAQSPWHLPALQGLAQGIPRKGKSAINASSDLPWPALLLKLMADHDPSLSKAAEELARALTLPDTPEVREWIDHQLTIADDFDKPRDERLRAIHRARCGPASLITERLSDILTVYETLDIQRAIIEALAETQDAAVGDDLLDDWAQYTPGIRKMLLEQLARYQVYLPVILEALENETIPPWSVAPPLKQRLLETSGPDMAKRAKAIFESSPDADQETYQRYLTVLQDDKLEPDPARGRTVFEEQCAACHKFAGLGNEVGPDLNTVLGRSPDQLLADILLPSQTITVGYEYYVIDTLDGQTRSGVITAESPTAITIREQEAKETTLLRENIDTIYASRLSMMPENLHELVTPNQLADLITFILNQPQQP